MGEYDQFKKRNENTISKMLHSAGGGGAVNIYGVAPAVGVAISIQSSRFVNNTAAKGFVGGGVLIVLQPAYNIFIHVDNSSFSDHSATRCEPPQRITWYRVSLHFVCDKLLHCFNREKITLVTPALGEEGQEVLKGRECMHSLHVIHRDDFDHPLPLSCFSPFPLCSVPFFHEAFSQCIIPLQVSASHSPSSNLPLHR